MGFLADIQAVKNLAKIKKGGEANFSISQITCLITNMPDAQKNLTKDEFEQVYALYKELRKCTTKMKLDMEGYLDTALKIIRRFDNIAPYEKYSGGNELEFSFLMEDIKKDEEERRKAIEEMRKEAHRKENQEYINYLVESSYGQLDIKDAEGFADVMYYYQQSGKDGALRQFDVLVNEIRQRNTPVKAMMKVSWLTGVLCPNGVLTNEESTALSKKYGEILTEAVVQSMRK